MQTFHLPFPINSLSQFDGALKVGNNHNYLVAFLVDYYFQQGLIPGSAAFWQWIADILYDNQAITQYEITYVSGLSTVGGPTTPIAQIVANMQTKYNQLINDPQVVSPSLRAMYSVGLESANYCLQQSQNPPPQAQTVNWSTVWTDDIGGAGVGATLNPENPAVGALIGGSIASAVSVIIQVCTC